MQQLHVQEAGIEHVPAILALVSAYWSFEGIAGFDPARIAGLLEGLLSSPSLGGVWIALDGDRVVGYLIGVYVFSLEHGGLTAEVDECWLEPSVRGAGLGARMVESAEAAFVKAGCTSVSLEVGKENAPGRRFWMGRGFADRAGFGLLEKALTKR